MILDELGYITFDLQGAELLFRAARFTYESSSIITSNLMFSEWVKVFHDKAYRCSVDRITPCIHILNMSEPVTDIDGYPF